MDISFQHRCDRGKRSVGSTGKPQSFEPQLQDHRGGRPRRTSAHPRGQQDDRARGGGAVRLRGQEERVSSRSSVARPLTDRNGTILVIFVVTFTIF